MCGIAGWLGRPPDDPGTVERVKSVLHHRGPDDSGDRTLPGATLVHTRLKVLDLSPAGHQPMASADGSVWTVFNGEIYNHRALRRELEARGHSFRGHCDTEVLPRLYQEHPATFATKLRGMFAVALYDVSERKLILVRDRLGIKPLYYSVTADRLAFASELNALREIPDQDMRPDLQAVHDFASLLYIPAPCTFYRGIRALEPGQMLEASLHADRVVWSLRRYQRWRIEPDFTLDTRVAADEVDPLLDQAVVRQMESDVPLGTLLSGGIDSSLITSAAARAAGRPIRSFNVRFTDREYDETKAAVDVATSVGTQHETLDFHPGGAEWGDIAGLLQAAGQPFADTSLFAVHAVCRLMRQHVTVALSGDGGDEGFGGYHFFSRLTPFAAAQHLPSGLQRRAWQIAARGAAAATPLRLLPSQVPGRLEDAARGTDGAGALESLLSWIRPRERERLWRGGDVDPVRRLFEPHWEHVLPKGASNLEHLSALATEVAVRLRLANDFLPKVDIASMQTSLEVRVPMLDEDLLAFGLRLPHRLKTKGSIGKPVLRAVARRRLPAAIAELPKHGFQVPIDRWVGGQFKARLREELLGADTRLSEFLVPDVYQPIVTAFCVGTRLPSLTREGLYQRVFMLLSLHLFLGR